MTRLRQILIGAIAALACAKAHRSPSNAAARLRGSARTEARREGDSTARVTVPTSDTLPTVTGHRGVVLHPQEMAAWHWAAAAQTAMEYLGIPQPPSYEQCAQATVALNASSSCCGETSAARQHRASPDCSRVGSPPWRAYGIECHIERQALPMAGIEAEIAQFNRPVVASIALNGTGQHTVVIYGYDTSGPPFLYVADPLRGSLRIAYSEYAKNRDDGFADYYGLTYVAAASTQSPMDLP